MNSLANPFTKSLRPAPKRGFTLVEMLVVVAIIGVLVALLLPAVQAAREAGRRAQCQNNLKQIGLGVQGYLSAHRVFPPGGVAIVDIEREGYNFVYWILPFMEGQAEYDKLEEGLRDSQRGNMAANGILRPAFPGKPVPWCVCPSSPFETWNEYVPYDNGTQPPLARFHGLDYAACVGSYEGVPRVIWNADAPLFQRRRAYSGLMPMWYEQWGWSPHSKMVGAKIPYRGKYGVRLREVTDGISHTIAVAETSGALLDASGQASRGRATTFFIQGPCCSDWQPTQHMGLITIALPVGFVDRQEAGARNTWPISSGHGPAGMVVMGDGSVHFFHEQMDVPLLYSLADRNDGKVIDTNILP